AYTVTTKKGQNYTGLLSGESGTALEILDAERKKQTTLKGDIDEYQQSQKSLMPDGFEKQVSRKDLTDLLEYLTQRGTYLPLPLTKVATVVSTRGMFFDESDPVGRLTFNDWSPKTFAGVPFHLVDPQSGRVPNA